MKQLKKRPYDINLVTIFKTHTTKQDLKRLETTNAN